MSNLLYTIIIIIPLYWAVYEFRNLRQELKYIHKTIDQITKKADDITSNRLDDYPFIEDVKRIVDKFNYFFNKKKKR